MTHRLLLLTLMTIFKIAFGQSEVKTTIRVEKDNTKSDYVYTDNYGNHIGLFGTKKYPDKIDSLFFKKNINGLHFMPNILELDKRFNFAIDNVTYNKREKNYKIILTLAPITDNINELLNYGEKRFYILKIKQDKGEIQFDSIIFDHIE